MASTISIPNESQEYRTARNALLDEERRLRQQVENVAKMRRQLPFGGALKHDYPLTEAASGKSLTFSELFAEGQDTLVVYCLMFRPEQETACPMCSGFLDSFDGVVNHLKEQVSVAVLAKAPADILKADAEMRGWNRLPLYSWYGTSFGSDYFAESPNGSQNPIAHVFRRNGADVYHHYLSELLFDSEDRTIDGQRVDPRHVDLLYPLWNTLDLTPNGRGDWYPNMS